MKKGRILLLSVAALGLVACGGGNGEKTTTAATIAVAPTEASTAVAETEINDKATTEGSTAVTEQGMAESEEVSQTYVNSAGEQVNAVAVYDYFNALLDSSDNPAKWEKIGNEEMEVNSAEWLKVIGEWKQKCEDYEQAAMEDAAKKFEITPEEVKKIYFDIYIKRTSEKPEVKIIHGTLLEVNQTTDNGVVIKVKISPSYSNKATIEQNYFNVEDFIKNQDGSRYDEIQYWSVADMDNGNEGKVISFTVNKDVIQAIAEEKIFAIELGDYVDDLYVLPSLLK